MKVREINRSSEDEVELVASRMRETLIEVLGEEVGGSMYTMDWLIQRVMWHLDPTQCTGEVFLSESVEGRVTGHTIVRLETDEDGSQFGLFSTFYVEPESRNQSIAKHLVQEGEQWMRDRGMTIARTYTAEHNSKLRTLMSGFGYEVVLSKSDMVALSRFL